ncbi:MAG: 3-dehydroquinate synthase [Ruminococcus sp.]|nr:3-dehydroquinate synthase [Candidatus Copronaster equi]
MDKLQKSREIIDTADRQIAELFAQRMEAAKCIAEYKAENNLSVCDTSREQKIIQRNCQYVNENIVPYYAEFLKSTIEISKKYQNAVINPDSIFINSQNGDYEIIIEKGCLDNVGKHLNLNRQVLIVTDNGVPIEYAKAVSSHCLKPTILTVEQGENSKNIKTCEMLLKVMLTKGFTRTDCVVAVGGGVVGDLAGFAASIFMRGIDFYNIPTTLLSQLDSSIGGKTAVNFGSVKNSVGAFYPPKKVLIDINTLKTLDKRQLANGMAEAVKMTLTFDADLFELIETEDVNSHLEEIIKKSLIIKKSVVELDEKESGLRKALNFGHTLGHAIEINTNLYHGECVALGMIKMCGENVRSRLIAVLKKLNLPTEININTSDLLNAIKHDKKSDGEFIDAVFVNEIGSFEIRKVKPEELLKEEV